MIVTLSSDLQPTLWRTCRTLANRNRLRIIQLLQRRGEQTVTHVAHQLRISVSLASQYLRALNARGLLRVRRAGPQAYYRTGADRCVPSAQPLVRALRLTFSNHDEAAERTIRRLTAFTHPRRVDVVRCLSQEPLTRDDLRARTGISRQSLERHLKKLRSRGFIEKRGRLYHCAASSHPLDQTLITLAIGSRTPAHTL